MRQADSVTAISAASDTTGGVSFLTTTGTTRTWSHDGGSKEVLFDNGGGNQLLAKNVESLSFIGFEADGVTQTMVVNDIQAVKCTVQVTLAGAMRTVSCRAWIRTW